MEGFQIELSKRNALVKSSVQALEFLSQSHDLRKKTMFLYQVRKASALRVYSLSVQSWAICILIILTS